MTYLYISSMATFFLTLSRRWGRHDVIPAVEATSAPSRAPDAPPSQRRGLIHPGSGDRAGDTAAAGAAGARASGADGPSQHRNQPWLVLRRRS